MKLHTTNYSDTFIEVADDCPISQGETPPSKGKNPSVAELQFQMLHQHPYEYTSDDLLFQVFADRNDLTEEEYAEARTKFFSKGQACLRASPLAKRYGWGVHHNADGKIAIFGNESEAYQKFLRDQQVKKVKAMRSKRK